MKKQPKMTPWFPSDVKPVRKGWYQRKYDNSLATSAPDKWDGKDWLIGAGADGDRTFGKSNRSLPWRGLTAKAAA